MRATIGRLVLAAVLFAAAAACWAEARYAREVAGAHARLATLHYDEPGASGDGPSWLSRLPLPIAGLDDEVRQRRAVSAYWRGDHDALRPTGSTPQDTAGAREAADPQRMFVMANASFRAAQRQAAEAKVTAQRLAAVAVLDSVMQSYGEVMRADPANADAAFNFEFAMRLRDTLASNRPTARTARQAAEEAQPVIHSADLPIGPTIHGRPGAPPPDIPGDQFRTIAPMPYEEREETDPGVGTTPRRRG